MTTKFLFDFDSFVTDKQEEPFPPVGNTTKYITLNKNNETLYLNLNDLLAQVLLGDDMIKYIKDELSKWNLENNYQRIRTELLEDPEYNTNPTISQVIELFNPNPFDTTEEIINDRLMIDEINRLASEPNGVYIKLLLTTLYSPVNSKKIFKKAEDLNESNVAELRQLESGDHTAGINDVDKLVAIREIVTSILIDTDSPVHDFSKLSETTRGLINDIRRLKNILIRYLNTPRRNYYLNPFLGASCTGVRSRWLCETLKNTELNCNSPPETFNEDHIKVIKELIIDILNNLDTITIEKDANKIIFKEEDKYMIGGRYYKKYLKYKAKYFQLKGKLN